MFSSSTPNESKSGADGKTKCSVADTSDAGNGKQTVIDEFSTEVNRREFRSRIGSLSVSICLFQPKFVEVILSENYASTQPIDSQRLSVQLGLAPSIQLAVSMLTKPYVLSPTARVQAVEPGDPLNNNEGNTITTAAGLFFTITEASTGSVVNYLLTCGHNVVPGDSVHAKRHGANIGTVAHVLDEDPPIEGLNCGKMALVSLNPDIDPINNVKINGQSVHIVDIGDFQQGVDVCKFRADDAGHEVGIVRHYVDMRDTDEQFVGVVRRDDENRIFHTAGESGTAVVHVKDCCQAIAFGLLVGHLEMTTQSVDMRQVSEQRRFSVAMSLRTVVDRIRKIRGFEELDLVVNDTEQLPATSALLPMTNRDPALPREILGSILTKVTVMLFNKHKVTDLMAHTVALITACSVCLEWWDLVACRKFNIRQIKRLLDHACRPYKRRLWKLNAISPATSDEEGRDVFGLAVLDDQIFVARRNVAEIAVYQATGAFERLRGISIKDDCVPTCLAADSVNGCLFMADKMCRCVWRIEPRQNGDDAGVVKKFIDFSASDESVQSVSAMPDGRLFVLHATDKEDGIGWKSKILVYDREGNQVDNVNACDIPDNGWCVSAAGKDDAAAFVSYGAAYQPAAETSARPSNPGNAGLLKINKQNVVSQKSPIDANVPRSIAWYENVLLVTDSINKRLMVYDAADKLKLNRVLLEWKNEVKQPVSVSYDAVGELLVVGFDDGTVELYKLRKFSALPEEGVVGDGIGC